MGESLVSAFIRAPLIACHPEHRSTFHAATKEAVLAAWVPEDVVTVVSACGATGLKLVDGMGDGTCVEWPPRVSSMPKGWTRCKSCHEATGRKRPRSEFKRLEVAGA